MTNPISGFDCKLFKHIYILFFIVIYIYIHIYIYKIYMYIYIIHNVRIYYRWKIKIYDTVEMEEWHWQWKTDVFEETCVPVPLCPSQKSYGQVWNKTRSPAQSPFCLFYSRSTHIFIRILFLLFDWFNSSNVT